MFKIGDRVVINDTGDRPAWKNIHGTIIGVTDKYLKIAVDVGSRYHEDHRFIGGKPVVDSYVAGGNPGYCEVTSTDISLEEAVNEPLIEKRLFKKGDRVRWTAENDGSWQDCIVREDQKEGEHRVFVINQNGGGYGTLLASWMELLPEKEKTPKELADRYREIFEEEKVLREERRQISIKLHAAGYKYDGVWWKREEI